MFRFPTKTPFARTSFPSEEQLDSLPPSTKRRVTPKSPLLLRRLFDSEHKMPSKITQTPSIFKRNAISPTQNLPNLPRPPIFATSITMHPSKESSRARNSRHRSKIIPVAFEIRFAARQLLTPRCVRTQEVILFSIRVMPLSSLTAR